jgi:hypothetical protein
MTSYIEATYIGQDDHGYAAGQAYCLEVHQYWFGWISVRPTYGYHYRPLEDMRCRYRNLKNFLYHWQINRVVEPVQ